MPVSPEWIQAIECGHKGWTIEVLDSIAKIQAVGNRLENCLATTEYHLVDWVELRFLFIKLVDPSGVPSLLEVDLLGSFPSPVAVQHRGLRNTDSHLCHQAIGGSVVNALQQIMGGEVGKKWRAENQHIQSLRRPLTSQEREMAFAQEAERLFVIWELAPHRLTTPVNSGGSLTPDPCGSPEDSYS
jgi:hypothetical protein